ncbi:MAG: benzoate-CoA ligase family protein [Inquilinaceae bacterium]
MTAHTAHVDTFARDNLPPRDQWPVFLLDGPDFDYPPRLNVVTEFVDRWVDEGRGDAPAIGAPGMMWTYAELRERIDRIANVLTGPLGMVPGNRVLLRAPNNPMLVATYMAVLKAGGVVVATMPLLRAKELGQIVDKARIALAICDHRLLDEMAKTAAAHAVLERIVPVGGDGPDDLTALMADAAPSFEACPTAADDVCLIGFTSGTTGQPKGTMHFHRDLLAICDGYGRHVLQTAPDDIVVGSPPLAFTFGLGGLVLFPLRVGASAILLEKASPPLLLEAIKTHRPTVCFTAPTAYRAMLDAMAPGDAASLIKCVSAGEMLPKATFEAWHAATGVEIMDGIGATEMLHIFIGSPRGQIRPGATGRPVPGYRAKIIDAEGRDLPPGEVGRLAVQGPTGCRYLADPRQADYVIDGWNVTGDTYKMDEDGYFWYQARSDDMIVTSGYNVAGPEVEAALLAHEAVAECGVVGAPHPERGSVVRAYVVLRDGVTGDAALVKTLQDFVKAEVAPYKYPREVVFVATLPRTETGKLQRFALRRMAEAPAAPGGGRMTG